MSWSGISFAQDAAIGGVDSRLAAAEAAVATKLAAAVYDAKVAAIDAKDAEQDGRLGSVETLAASKVASMTYSAKMALLDAKDAEHTAALAVMDAAKLSVAAHDAKMALLDAKDADLTQAVAAVEGRVTAVEGDISGRVQAAIDEKVAQTVFDSLATELRNADSALTASLATKVAAVTQQAVDEAQNGVIATKASIAGVNNALNGLVSQFNQETQRLDAVDASKVAAVDYQAKVDALEEFIGIMLQTYGITKPTGGAYEYTGVKQNLLAPAFSPENPTNIAASGFVLEFDLPNTINQLSFVDVNVGGQWYQAWRGAVAPPNANVLALTRTRVQMNLPVMVTGSVNIFTRYDVHTGNSNAGFASITL